GCVRSAEIPKLRAQIERALYALRDPETKQPVVRRVYAREELFDGPQLERAPDLLLELALDRGYSYNVMPTRVGADGVGVFRRLAAHEYLGRKGRSMPGAHRDRGLFIAAGPSIKAAGELDAHMADVSATLLARMQIVPPPELDGHVLNAALQPGHAAKA